MSLSKASITHTPYEPERSTFVSFKVTNVPAWWADHLVYHELLNFVTFIPFPPHVAEHGGAWGAPTRKAAPADGAAVSVFIGQLPFSVTPAKVEWACRLFGGDVSCVEPILKPGANGVLVPTGGVHLQADAASLARMEQGMHNRLLIDDAGLWFAATLLEKARLDNYVSFLRADRGARRPGHPHRSVVVQAATSPAPLRQAQRGAHGSRR